MNPQDQFINSTMAFVPRRSPREDFMQSAQPQPDPVQAALSNQEPIVNLLKRYEVSFGDSRDPLSQPADVSLPLEADSIYRSIFGKSKAVPINLNQTIGEIKEALRGALTQKKMLQSGQQVQM